MFIILLTMIDRDPRCRLQVEARGAQWKEAQNSGVVYVCIHTYIYIQHVCIHIYTQDIERDTCICI